MLAAGSTHIQPMDGTPTLEAARDYIDAIDFSPIIDKMVKHQGWLRKDALTVCLMYRRFLWLNKKYSKSSPLPPSEEIDAFWHNHILDTKKYRKDSEAIFGQYFDHYPYFGIDGKTGLSDANDAFQNTLKLYKKEFREELYQVRSLSSYLAIFLKWVFKLKKGNKYEKNS